MTDRTLDFASFPRNQKPSSRSASAHPFAAPSDRPLDYVTAVAARAEAQAAKAEPAIRDALYGLYPREVWFPMVDGEEYDEPVPKEAVAKIILRAVKRSRASSHVAASKNPTGFDLIIRDYTGDGEDFPHLLPYLYKLEQHIKSGLWRSEDGEANSLVLKERSPPSKTGTLRAVLHADTVTDIVEGLNSILPAHLHISKDVLAEPAHHSAEH